MTEYCSIEELLANERDQSVHVECGRNTVNKAIRYVHEAYATRRTAFYVETDKGFDRDTVRSYLRFFARLAGGSVMAEEALAHFGLKSLAKVPVKKLSSEQRALLNYARMSLFEPEVVFCERPLADITPDTRSLVLSWLGQVVEAGGIVITCGESMREALLLPGTAFYEEEGRFFSAQVDSDSDGDAEYDGDEVFVFKVPVKSGESTLLLDPREIDFVESVNRSIYASVRGELYPVQKTLDELEAELERFGFFRCHRSYLVNVQKVAKVERFTRNSFNLALSDVAHTSIPLAKGRAERMRQRYGWK